MEINDSHNLRSRQYRDGSNLNARAALHQNYSTNPQGWFNWLFEQSGIQPGERLLEVGGGPGYLWRDFLPLLPAGCRLVFSDFSPGMVDETRRTLPSAQAAVRLAVIDAQHIPFPAASFDRVMAHFMLYHVPNRAQAIAEFWRVLRPGGTLLAATNGRRHMRQMHAYLRRVHGQPDEQPAVRSGFDLEDGGEQLRACFPQVDLLRYPDSLRVTHVQAILDYLLSMWQLRRESVDEEALARLREELEAQVQRDGYVPIDEDSGLFVARKPT